MGNSSSKVPKKKDVFRVVILGKTGSGKSFLGNNILQKKNAFKVGNAMNSVTAMCAYHKVSLIEDEIDIEVVDTPGLCDTDRSEEYVITEISKCVTLTSPGPHIMLWVIRFDQRFSNDEYHAFEQMIEVFSEKILQHILIVFTGENIKNAERNITTGMRTNPKLKELMEKITNGHVVIDNCDDVTKRAQVSVLLKKCREIVDKNDGQHFSHDITEDVQRILDGIYLKKSQESGLSMEEIREKLREEILRNETTIMTLLSLVGNALLSKIRNMCTIQ